MTMAPTVALMTTPAAVPAISPHGASARLPRRHRMNTPSTAPSHQVKPTTTRNR